MRRISWISIAKIVAVTLLAISFLVPLYAFPTRGNGGSDPVFAWNVMPHDPLAGLIFLAPLLAAMLVGRRLRRPWAAVAANGLLLARVTVVRRQIGLRRPVADRSEA
jgi:hypothetical protein